MRLRHELSRMLPLALPVIAAEIAWMGMGIVDTVMVGPLGAVPLGGVSVGRVWFFTFAIFGVGLLFGLDTLVSRAFGAGDRGAAGSALVHGLVLAVVASVPLTLLIRIGAPRLRHLDVTPEVLAEAVPYAHAVSFGVLPLLLYTAFRRFLQGIDTVKPVMLLLVSANLVNVVGNHALIHGRFGFPALGATGAGWSSTVSYTFLAAGMGLVVALEVRDERTPIDWRLRVETAKTLLRLGIPAAGQVAVEFGAFALAGLLVARLPPVSLAAHHIALTLASLTYMVPLGLSSAGAVRVGQALGRRRPDQARAAGWTAVGIGVAFMALAAVAFVAFPGWLLGWFTREAPVVAAGVTLLRIAALFQLFDGIQAVATGILRGASDTSSSFRWNLLGHWVIGIPAGVYLCFPGGMGAPGVWIGWLVGLGVVAVALLVCWHRLPLEERVG